VISNQRLSRWIALAVSRRLAMAAAVFVAIIYLSYLGLGMAGGVRFGPAVLQAAERSWKYLGNLLQGDLGMTSVVSILHPYPVSEVLPTILTRSLGLLGVSLLIAAVFGTVLGLLAALQRRSGLSLLMLVSTIIGISVPSFLLALLLQIGVIKLNRFLGTNILPVGGFGWDNRLILPALVLAARPLAQITRVTFITVGEILQQDYVRTAHSKGVPGRQVINPHVLKNAAIPVLTTVVLSLRFSLSSLPVVEYFFGWQGVGFTLLKTIARQDHAMTIALLLSLGALFMAVNVILDASYRLIDPRLREVASQTHRRESFQLTRLLKSAGASLLELARRNPIERFLPVRKRSRQPHPFKNLAGYEVGLNDEVFSDGRPGELRAWLKGTIGNLSLMAGSLLLALLLVVVLFGPDLAPHSPYTTRGLEYKGGQFLVPPFPPGELYPWGTDVLGRDLMSLILAGAQQTLLLASLVMAARMVVGFILGAAAGWFQDSKLDRFVLSLAEIIASFPTLLLAMILILAFNIRLGMLPFILALCLVGWGEIMQYIRVEVINIRPRLFIESAYALGARPARIVQKHVLPNLVPALVALAALEMGSVLMLLGELGFISIFIGGGAFAQLDVAAPFYHYSDTPEWGAMLANIRTYARAYPWMALYPGLAFFTAILGFNMFGEGLRRFLDIVGVRVAKVANRYTFAAALVVLAGFFWFRGSTGSLAYYQKQASAFDGQKAMEALSWLAAPELEGRSVGSLGSQAAADYIAAQFQELGLQPAGEKMTYFQNRTREFLTLDETPVLTIEDGEPDPIYQVDYAEFAKFRAVGQAQARVRAFAIGELSLIGTWGNIYQSLTKLNYSGEILMVVDEEDLMAAMMVSPSGIFYVAGEEYDLALLSTLSPRPPRRSAWGGFPVDAADIPVMIITEATANRILKSDGLTVRDLRRKISDLARDEVFELVMTTPVSIEIEGILNEKVEARHVLGHLPGKAAEGQTKLDDELVVVVAQYDSPPQGPSGQFYPGANDNASGVALMLEVIRTMKETGYQPNRTFMFVAYSGEGLEGGEPAYPKISKFLQAKLGFESAYKVEAIIELRGLGSQGKEGLVNYAGGNQRLMSLFEKSASMEGTASSRGWEPVSIGVVFDDQTGRGQEAPSIQMSWSGWESTSRLPGDTVENISQENLEKAGRVICLGLMILGQEHNY
jgi:peptide/nickel transport system permease protein